MSWPGIQDTAEEDGRLSHDLIVASFAAKRVADGRSRMLEREVEDLNEQLSELLDENEELHGEVEHLAELANGYESAEYADWSLYDDRGRDSDDGCYYYDFDDDPLYLARFWDQM